MCLLIVAYKKFPPREVLQKAEKTNSDGAGIAWIEDGVVKWKKGLKAKDLMEMSDLPFPILIHFRKATVGKAIPELTHPFCLDLDKSLQLEGESEKGVLAHNGGWYKWHETMTDLINEGNPIPKGSWSDSRAMAWTASVKGVNVLDGLSFGDKIAVLTPERVERFGNWGLVDKEAGIAYSYNPFTPSYCHDTRSYAYGNFNRKSNSFRKKEFSSFNDYVEHSIKKEDKLNAQYENWKAKQEERVKERK